MINSKHNKFEISEIGIIDDHFGEHFILNRNPNDQHIITPEDIDKIILFTHHCHLASQFRTSLSSTSEQIYRRQHLSISSRA